MNDNSFPIQNIMFFSSNANNGPSAGGSGGNANDNNSSSPNLLPGGVDASSSQGAANNNNGSDNNSNNGSAVMSGNMASMLGNNMGLMGLQQQLMQQQQQNQLQQQQLLAQQQNQMDSSQNDSSSGYPLLLQEYLLQQQQLQQQLQQQDTAQLGGNGGIGPNSAAGFENKMGAAMGNSNPMLQRSVGSFGSAGALQAGLSNNSFQHQGNLMGGQSNWTAAGPPSITGTQTSSASDLSLASDRMLLQRLQQGASNASFLAAAAATATNSAPGTSRDPYAEQGILGPWSERSAGLLGKMVCSDPTGVPAGGKVKRTRRKQPKDKPKRPLSAYNIFFKEERARLLDKAEDSTTKRTANGKIGFENLAKIIGGKWQDLKPSEVEYYKEKASADMERYKKEMEEYNKKQTSKASSSSPAASDESGDDGAAGDLEEDEGASPSKKQKTS